jgi:putative transposase
VSTYPLIEAEKAEGGNVAKTCALLEVSRSAYYEWSKHRPSRRQLADAELLDKIAEVFDASRATYGWPRVHVALRRAGICASRKRVARLMAQAGLVGRCRRKKTAPPSPIPRPRPST